MIVARTTESVRAAAHAQSARGDAAAILGDLLTSAVLVRETMAPTLRVQCILSGAGDRGRIVADSYPDGAVRGLLAPPEGQTTVALGEGAVLQVMRSMPSGAMHTGAVEAPARGGVPAALMAYMQTSEQVASMISMATVLDGDTIRAAGGYVVQLLPEVGEGPLMVMAERLQDFEDISRLVAEPAFTPDALLAELLYAMPYTRLEESAVRFECKCSQVRVMSSLATLPRTDIEELIADGEILEIGCDYCNRQYRVSPAQLQGLLGTS